MSGYIFILLTIVFVAVLFGMVFAGARLLLRDMRSEQVEQDRERSRTPRAILERRYARGEINRAEFEEKLKDVEKHENEDGLWLPPNSRS